MAPLISSGGMKMSSSFAGSLARIGAHEAVAVAMQIEAAGDEVVAGGRRCSGNAPVLAIGLDEVAAGGHAGELLEEQTALAAAAEAEFAHQLLVSGFAAGGACDAVAAVRDRSPWLLTMVQGT